MALSSKALGNCVNLRASTSHLHGSIYDWYMCHRYSTLVKYSMMKFVVFIRYNKFPMEGDDQIFIHIHSSVVEFIL